ncbi:hypothetical protein QCA50_012392 [Cerrena zonata]|uniref:Fungal-type protein kinase domain-containing protein n=1 Tax=Cerrena zonata TaxID=2478898 RepID=A0AAW0G619_9APHY
MVILPRFWGGLPFPPSYLVELSRDLNMGKDPLTFPPTEIYKRFYSEPRSEKATSSDVQRLFDSEPTPISTKVDELVMRGADDSLVKLALLKALQDKIDVNYDVVEFVQHILKFTPDDIPDRENGYTLHKDSCQSFSDRTYHKLDTPHQQMFAGERACCHAFQEIVWDLTRQLDPGARDTRSFPAKLTFMHEQIVQGDFASYKPDFAYSVPAPAAKEAKWEFMGSFGEVKKTRASVFRPGRSNKVSMAKIKNLREDWAKTTSQSKNASKAVTPEPPKPTTPSKITTRAGSKRKAAAEAVIRTAKKIKIDKTRAASTLRTRPLVKFTGPEMQTAKYINELLSHGIRAYAFGFLLQETRMSLWYVDRMGMATSQSFDIFLNPELFVLVVAALHFADRDKLGTIPLVKYPDDASRSHDKATLELPRAIGSDGAPIDEQLSFGLRVSAASPLIVAYGAVGRGTTVVPITSDARARELFGKDKLVAKLCWPSTKRRDEAEIIRMIRTKLKENKKAKVYLKNIVDLKCSLDMSAVEIGLPRAFMDLTAPYEPRLLRTLIMVEYLPLEQIRSLDDFKVVFDRHFRWYVVLQANICVGW